MLAGASAVQVGTATFAEPRAAARIAAELADGRRSRLPSVAELTGEAHAVEPDGRLVHPWATAHEQVVAAMVALMATPPQLSPEQRTAALAKAARPARPAPN
jgi:hypothetical protein